MRYVAALESPVTGLPESAQCFISDFCRITKFNSVWVLESTKFDACSSPTEVFPLADETLSVARRIMSLYSGLSYPFIVSYIQGIDAGGQPCGRTIRSSLTMKTTSPTALSDLTKLVHGQPLATAILECAQKDTKVSEALKLFQDIVDRWTDIYDIIEYLGGPSQIGQSGLGTPKKARVVRQTANYYRHLGSPKPTLLPSTPPTLGEASLFAKQALSRWIESRL